MNSLSDGIDLSDVKIIHYVNRPRNTWPFNEKTQLTHNNKHAIYFPISYWNFQWVRSVCFQTKSKNKKQ